MGQPETICPGASFSFEGPALSKRRIYKRSMKFCGALAFTLLEEASGRSCSSSIYACPAASSVACATVNCSHSCTEVFILSMENYHNGESCVSKALQPCESHNTKLVRSLVERSLKKPLTIISTCSLLCQREWLYRPAEIANLDRSSIACCSYGVLIANRPFCCRKPQPGLFYHKHGPGTCRN